VGWKRAEPAYGFRRYDGVDPRAGTVDDPYADYEPTLFDISEDLPRDDGMSEVVRKLHMKRRAQILKDWF
jgi:hypothetical protein